ncbi:uncharacterized protein Bfra_007534 [Botrytis fragariae]|uniref:Uncharacterized protein n=1 Tax=Botrytis fragariae TaxID=1964551 RepID=A0A8H6EDN9_9HELO|nr:uncharacterized protein Bfra_007534 [Botrytis fragariae]KAF5868336.1 hypothetical protein Bfra_007534 [Botrytis fragariae]
MNTSTKIQPSSSSQSTKNTHQPTDSVSSKPPKSTYRILRDAGFRSMNDFMFSYGLKLHNDEHLAQAKEMIERMKEEDLRGEDLRRLVFARGSDEESAKDERGPESSEDGDGAVELIGSADVVGGEEVEDGVQLRGAEVGRKWVGFYLEKEDWMEMPIGMVDGDNFVEAFGYDYVGDGDNDGYGDVYDDQDEFEDDFEDGFEGDFFYDD